jgi:hypothetical protein
MKEIILKKGEAKNLYGLFASADFPKPFAYEALRNAINLRAVAVEFDEIIKGLLQSFGSEQEAAMQRFLENNPHLGEITKKIQAWESETVSLPLMQIKHSDLEKLQGTQFNQSLILATMDFFIEKT